jgi:hypothetical protein
MAASTVSPCGTRLQTLHRGIGRNSEGSRESDTGSREPRSASRPPHPAESSIATAYFLAPAFFLFFGAAFLTLFLAPPFRTGALLAALRAGLAAFAPPFFFFFGAAFLATAAFLAGFAFFGAGPEAFASPPPPLRAAAFAFGSEPTGLPRLRRQHRRRAGSSPINSSSGSPIPPSKFIHDAPSSLGKRDSGR